MRLGDDKCFAVSLVPFHRDVAGDFQVLFLIAPNGDRIGIINQNVRRHQHRISKEAMVRGNPFGDFIFVTGAALQQAHRSNRRQHPGQLRHFRHIRLAKENRLLRIQPAGQEIQRHIQRIGAALLGIEQRSHRVIIGDEIKGLPFFLQFNGWPHHPKIIPDVQRAGRLYAG